MKSKSIIFLLCAFIAILLAAGILSNGGVCGYKRFITFNELTILADKFGTDKGSSYHYYTEVYDRFFLPIKDSARKIFEIGIEKGASLKMWQKYFPNAVIYGIDIVDCSYLDSDSIKTSVADQSDRNQLKRSIDIFGGDFDIIVDDGGHGMEQQQVSFGYLFKYVKPGGYYIIEDVHTSLLPGYGLEDEENSTLKMIENFIRNGKIKSKYMTEEEKSYLADRIEFCNLFRRQTKNTLSINCIFKKKDLFKK